MVLIKKEKLISRKKMFKTPIQRLNFSQDSDDADESSGYSSLDSPNSFLNMSNENRDLSVSPEGNVDFWDSGLATPKGSPGQGVRRLSRRSDVSPIRNFSLESSPYTDSKSIKSDKPNGTNVNISGTPPHRRFRNLRLFDSPQTPKSLLQQQDQKSSERRRTRNIAGRLFSGGPKPHLKEPQAKTVGLPRSQRKPRANVNPFTPGVMNANGVGQGLAKKRQRPERKNSVTDELEPMDDDFDQDESEYENPSKRVALHDSNISRYEAEFLEVCKIGSGEFGSVYKCINRLDGCTYAVKKSKKPIAGSVLEKMALNEVYAHAVLGAHIHVVRYYSAWAEDNHMIIQNEFCNGGSLADVISQHMQDGKTFSEPQLKQVLLQVAQGLEYIHMQGLVHLDIKPGNIFISHQARIKDGLHEIKEDEESNDKMQSYSTSPMYKIGDLGHVTSVANPKVEEGDIRYLPNEILQEDFDHLPKADVFSLALSVYESGGGGPLPKNGDDWHRIREGLLPPLRHLSHDLNELLKDMVNPDPTQRPSVTSLVQHSLLCPQSNVVFTELKKELNAAKFQNAVLSRELNEARNSTAEKASTKFTRPVKNNSRIIGKKVNRSMSVTIY